MSADAQTAPVLQYGTGVSMLPRQRQQVSGREVDMARRRWQAGKLFVRGKRQRVWVLSYREDIVDSLGNVQRVRRSVVLGMLADFPTRKLARRRADAVLAHVNSPSYKPGRVGRLADFVESWRRDVLAHRKPSTVKAAESHLRSILPTLGNLRLDQLNQENVQQFVSSLAKRLSRHTILNVLGTLGSVLKTAKSWGYLVGEYRREELAIPSVEERRPARYFTAEEARAILAACEEEPYRTMFYVAAMTGMRPGEVCGLAVEDLDFERKLIHVRRSAWYGNIQAPKSRSSVRALPMPSPLEARLRAYLATWKPNPRGLLFATRRGKPQSANSVVQRKLWPILDRLGIPRVGLHAFRHTASTLLVDLGAAATVSQAQLGHSDARLTLSTYAHVVPQSQRDAVERLAEILEPNGAKSEGSSKWVH